MATLLFVAVAVALIEPTVISVVEETFTGTEYTRVITPRFTPTVSLSETDTVSTLGVTPGTSDGSFLLHALSKIRANSAARHGNRFIWY